MKIPRLNRKENDDLKVFLKELDELEKIVLKGLEERLAFREEIRLQLSEAQRQKDFKNAQLAAATGIDVQLLKGEIAAIDQHIEGLTNMFQNMTDVILEAKQALMSIQLMKLGVIYNKFTNVDWRSIIKKIRVRAERGGDTIDGFRALCSEINKITKQMNLRIEVLGNTKKVQEVLQQ